MILALALAALLAQAASGRPAPAQATPTAGPALPPATGTAATPVSADDDAAPDLEQLRQMYRDTCEAREYGAYDDMCDQLRQQVREAERQAARKARRRPKATPYPISPP